MHDLSEHAHENECRDIYRDLAEAIGFNPDRIFQRNNPLVPRRKFFEVLEQAEGNPVVDEYIDQLTFFEQPSIFEEVTTLYEELAEVLGYEGEIYCDYIDVHPDFEQAMRSQAHNIEVAELLEEIDSLKSSPEGKIVFTTAKIYGQLSHVVRFKHQPYNRRMELNPKLGNRVHNFQSIPAVEQLLGKLKDVDDYISAIELAPYQIRFLIQDANAILDCELEALEGATAEIAIMLKALAIGFKCEELVEPKDLINEIVAILEDDALTFKQARLLMDLLEEVKKYHPIIEKVHQRNRTQRDLEQMDASITAFALAKSEENA